VRARKVPSICKTLQGIVPPKTAVYFQVGPVKRGRTPWSAAAPLPAEQEIPYPAKVRFLDKNKQSRWGFVLVDPTHEESRPHVFTPSLVEHRRQTAREWARRAAARGKRSALREQVAALREEVERLKHVRANPDREEP